MQKRLHELHDLGAELIAITQSKPQALLANLLLESRKFPFLCDPDRTAYRAFGLERGDWWMFFRPRVMASYLWQMLRGWGLRRPIRGEDVLQLGGDFILDVDGRIIFAHRSADPNDRPTVDELLGPLKGLATQGASSSNAI